jgi:predicted RNase H-like HicB family nuclease
MEGIVKLHIKKLPESLSLATSDDIQGLMAQGRTIRETLELARDVAKKLLEARGEREVSPQLAPLKDAFDYPLVVSA